MTQKKIIQDLSQLSDEERAKIESMIGSMLEEKPKKNKGPKKKSKGPQQQKQQNKSRKKRKKYKKVDNPDNEVIIEQEVGRSGPRKKIQLPNEPEQSKGSAGVGRTAPRNPENQITESPRRGGSSRRRGSPVQMGRGKGNIQAVGQKVVLTGENKFEKMRDRNSCKSDTKIDKKLWTDREALQRPDDFKFVEVQCTGPFRDDGVIDGCGLWFDVNPALLLRDEETGNITYTCNNCTRSGR